MPNARIFYGHLSLSLPLAISYIKRGGVIASPTDTVYGFLGLYREDVIHRVHKLKGREEPFLILLSNFYQIEDFAQIENWQYDLIQKLMPGKNTVIFEKKKSLPYPKGDTIALRIPDVQDSLFLTHLLRKTGALVAPSLNRHGLTPLHDLKSIEEQFGKNLSAIFMNPHYRETASSKIWHFKNRTLVRIR